MAFDHLKQQVQDINQELDNALHEVDQVRKKREKVYADTMDQGLYAREIAILTGQSHSLISAIAKRGRAQR